jgi:hypothetical protein
MTKHLPNVASAGRQIDQDVLMREGVTQRFGVDRAENRLNFPGVNHGYLHVFDRSGTSLMVARD